MNAVSENYKGIQFVRISSLENNEKNLIKNTLKRDKIIKILRGTELLSDCVQYEDYIVWRKQNVNKQQEAVSN